MKFKKFLGNFVEISEDEKPKLDPSKPLKPQVTGQTSSQEIPITTKPTYIGPPTQSSSSGSSLEDLNNFREHFKQLLADYNKNSMPGLDFFEFIEAKNNMPLPVESQKYTIAFSAQKAAGLTKEILLRTGKEYQSVVENEWNGFNSTFEQAYKDQVESKKAAVEQKQQMMLQLSKQIDDLNKEITVMRDETMQSESMLMGKKDAFERAANETKQILIDEMKKIDQYIQ